MTRVTLSLNTAKAMLSDILSAPEAPRMMVGTDWRHCLYCGVQLKRNHPEDALTREHILPRSEGGFIVIPACKTCNLARGHRKLKDWLCSAELKVRTGQVWGQPGWKEPPSIKLMLWLHGEAKRHVAKPKI